MNTRLDVSKLELARRLESNFITFARRSHGIDGAKFHEDSTISEITVGFPVASANRVFRFNADSTSSLVQQIRQVLKRYEQRQSAMLWHAGVLTTKIEEVRATLLTAGLKQQKSFVGMILDTAKFRYSPPLPKLRIEVLSESQKVQKIKDWLRPFATSFDASPEVQEHFRLCMQAQIGQPHEENWLVGYVDDLPVTSASYLIAHGVILLYSISTLPAFRRNGYARRITEAAISQALKYAQLPVALYTTADNPKLYYDMGFSELYELGAYLFEPNKSQLHE